VRDTVEECEREMREAIQSHVEGPRADGEPVPAPARVAAAVGEVLTDPLAVPVHRGWPRKAESRKRKRSAPGG
jgi:hypothetical protein